MERANIFHSNEKFHQRKFSSSHIVTALTWRKTFRSGTIIIRDRSRVTCNKRYAFSDDIDLQWQSNRIVSASRGLLCRVEIKTEICRASIRKTIESHVRDQSLNRHRSVRSNLVRRIPELLTLRSAQLVTRRFRCFKRISFFFRLSRGLFHLA